MTTLIKQPYTISFSGNPMIFLWQLTGTLPEYLTVRVLLEHNHRSGVFAEVYRQKMYPNAAAQVQLDVSTIIDPYLSYYTPRTSLDVPKPATGQYKRFRVEVVASNAWDLPGAILPTTYHAIKGSLAYEAWHYKEFFTQVVAVEKKPLIFGADGALTAATSLEYMYWLCTTNTWSQHQVTYKVYYSDQTTATKTLSQKITLPQWGVGCTPAGFEQCGLHLLEPTKYPLRWSVQVTAVEPDPVIVQEYFYTIDQRHFYDATHILYRNSIGGLQSIRLTGETETEGDYNSQEALRTLSPAWYTPHLAAQLRDEGIEEAISFTGNTGWITKAALDRLRDLFLSTQKWMYTPSGTLQPIAWANKKVKFFSNRDRMHQAQLAWQLAYVNSAYTPAGLMPQQRTCPQVLFLDTLVDRAKAITFFWALEDPYTKIEIQVVLPFDGGTYVYTYDNNAGTATVFLPGVDENDPPLVEVKARTICNADSDPIEYGPFTQVSAQLIGDTNPVPVEDFFEVPRGFSGILPHSLLDNDYDLDGNDFKVVEDWQLISTDMPTSSPGSLTVNEAGWVTLNVPQDFTGRVRVPYQIYTPGKTNYVTGYFNIAWEVPPQNVYVKWVFRNITQSDINMQAEPWIDFYSDPACTEPLDITGRGIRIEAKYVRTGAITGEKNYSFTGTGTRQRMEGKIAIYTRRQFQYNFETVFTILPGPGYIAVNP